MATQQVRPDRGSIDGQQTPERRRARRERRLGTLAVVATIGVVAVVVAAAVIVANGANERGTGAAPAIPPNSEPLLIPHGGPQAVSTPPSSYVLLPPEGAEPSTPRRGRLIASEAEFRVGVVYVYADGRVISWLEGSGQGYAYGYNEQRLTSHGVDLVRSGAISPQDFILHPGGVPAGAFEGSTTRPYVPSRYGICLGSGYWRPPPGNKTECFVTTTEEARTLDEHLTDAGFSALWASGGWERWTPEGSASDPHVPLLSVAFYPVLPDGTFKGPKLEG